MKKNKRTSNPSSQTSQEKPSTLKDLLDPAILAKLSATGKDLKEQEVKKKEEERKKQVEEQKRREKNKSFAELFKESKLDWKQYK